MALGGRSCCASLKRAVSGDRNDPAFILQLPLEEAFGGAVPDLHLVGPRAGLPVDKLHQRRLRGTVFGAQNDAPRRFARRIEMKVEKARRQRALQVGCEQNAVFGQAFRIVADHQRVGQNRRRRDVLDANVRRALHGEILLALNEHRHVDDRDVVLLQRLRELHHIRRDDRLRAGANLNQRARRRRGFLLDEIRARRIAGDPDRGGVGDAARIVRDAHGNLRADGPLIGDGDDRIARRLTG